MSQKEERMNRRVVHLVVILEPADLDALAVLLEALKEQRRNAASIAPNGHVNETECGERGGR